MLESKVSQMLLEICQYKLKEANIWMNIQFYFKIYVSVCISQDILSQYFEALIPVMNPSD